MKTELAHEASVKGVEKFDKAVLKQTETQEKNPLPDPEGKQIFAVCLQISICLLSLQSDM